MTRACRSLTAWRRLAAPVCAAALLAAPRPAPADTCSGLGFGAPAFVPTGPAPSAVAVGDFSRDGKLDIATANQQSANGLSILLGNGGGGFGTPTSLASAASAADIVAGDLDRDGWLDLVVASGSSAQVMVHGGSAGGVGGGTLFPVLAVPSRVALADFDRDGRLDLVVVGTASHRILVFRGLGNLSFDSTPVADLSPTGTPGPQAAVPGDFTGDGRLDLAVAEYNTGRVDLFVGNGTGALTEGPSTTLGGAGPRDLSAGDIDRDGRLDLVVAQATTSEVLVLLGQGDGTFQPATPVAVGAAPARVALGDLDHDGAEDLVVLDGTGRVVAFEGGGTAPAVFGPTPYPAANVSGTLSGLALGDFTSDARPDVVTTRTATNEAMLIADQSGSPCARSSFAVAPRSYWIADGPVSAAAADFDRDGRVDLAVATTNDSFVRVRRSTGGDFVLLADFGPFSSPPRGLATADLDFDGQPDLVVALGDASSGRVQVILHDVTGALTIGPSTAAGTNTAAVATGDFDGNGTPDVAAVSENDGSVWVFPGDGAGAFTPFRGNPVLSGLTKPRALVAADLTGDGLADIAVAESGGGAVHVLRAVVNAGTLTFSRVTPPAGLAVGANPESIAAGDLDGDGQVDLATADNGSSRVSVIRRAAGGGFLAAEPHTTGASPTAVALVDLTGDGRLDIAATISATRTLTVLDNRGGGTFASAGGYAVRGYPRWITPADADADGRLDLAVTCQTADAVVVLRTRPRLLDTDPVFDLAPHVSVGSHPRSAAVADLDGDGKLDLAVANQADSTVSILLNDGAGSFHLSGTASVAGAGPESIVAGDFNRDGHVDLAVSAPLATPRGIMILLGSATTPGDLVPQPITGVGSPSSVPDDLAVGDFDRDGILDLAVCDKSAPGTVYVLHGSGSGGFSTGATIAVGDQPTAIVAADFNRDGYLDLAVANEGANTIQVLRNTGTSFTVLTPPLTLPGTDVNPGSIAAADFDRDGDADLAVAAFGGDRVHVYPNETGTLTSLPAASLDAPYLLRSVTTGDVNLDGRPDLLAVATGLTVFRSRGSLAFEPPETVVAGWLPQAVVVGELSGDGWPDLAVVNEDSGDVSLLLSAPCQARRLEVSTHPTACETGLPPYSPAATVVAYDAGGNVAGCAAGTVVPSIVPGTGATGAVLGGTQASGVAVTSGTASFAGLTIDRPGRRYQLQFSLGSLPPARTRSFTLGPALSIVGVPSMCPDTSSTFSTEGSYDEYAWTLTPDVVPSAATHVPTVTLHNPPVTGAHTLGVSARVDGCFLQASQAVFGGLLQGTTLAVDGPATVCVDCIAGTIRPLDQGGGPALARQWGYRTLSGGAVTDMPGETAETYVLKGASFPGPGIYQVVVRTTPTCGVAIVSGELQVEVLSTVPSEEVQHLAASSRGSSSTGGQNLIQWVNVTSGNEVRILWNKAPTPAGRCLPPASALVTADGQFGVAPPLPTVSSFLHADDGAPPGLDFDTTYCYSVFVQTATGWSKGRTVQARPFNADAGPVKWAYSTGATAVVAPVVGYDGILAMSNDRTVHSLTRGGANGGHWPSSWVPYALTGVAHSRSPVVPFGDASPVFPNRSVLFAADDLGDVHAVDASTGQTAWAGPRAQGKPIVGAPGGLFTQYQGIADLIIVGTRDTAGPNQLRALAAGDGAPVGGPYDAGGTIGPISGSPAIDYATGRVYFTSRSHNDTGPTVWCVQVDGTTPFVPCSSWTARNLGDVDGSPVLRGGRLYFGSADGLVYSLDAATGLGERTFETNDGPVKGFVFPDRRNDNLIFATNTKVWSIADTGAAAMPLNWEWTAAGLNPSTVLFWPQTSFVYVGSGDGRLYQLDFSSGAPTSTLVVLGDGRAQVGAPSLDIGVAPPDVGEGRKLLVVGSESGTLYGVEVPF